MRRAAEPRRGRRAPLEPRLGRTTLGLLSGALTVALTAPVAAQPDAGATPGPAPEPSVSTNPEGLPSDEQLTRRSGAWDGSVQLERTGRPLLARSLLTHAWGPQPSSYEVALRLGWLSLALGEGDQAAAAYDRARWLPGADYEAVLGLSSGLTMAGYDDYEAGDAAAARESWRNALYLNPAAEDARRGLVLAREQRFDPELWLAFVGTTGPDKSLVGGSALVHLPLQLKDWVVLRAAYRHLESSVSTAAPAATPMGSGRSGRSRRFSENDLFAGLGIGLPWLWLDAWGAALLLDGEKPVGGELARLRVGRHWGMVIDQAALGRQAGWNAQVAPQAFVWPIPELGLSAGAHVTLDEIGDEIGAIAGASLVTSSLEIHLQGHLGRQRWPASVDGPTVLTTDGDLTAGGKLSVMVPMSEQWALGLQGQVERVEVDEGAGVYGSAALGLRWSPHWFLDDRTATPSQRAASAAGSPPTPRQY
ncbi:MAG: hypothetical protein JRI68_13125 [Deltaproteobacteria bacterium]|nr:hypothetical protein [Deltaproteobacteria bacterium]